MRNKEFMHSAHAAACREMSCQGCETLLGVGFFGQVCIDLRRVKSGER